MGVEIPPQRDRAITESVLVVPIRVLQTRSDATNTQQLRQRCPTTQEQKITRSARELLEESSFIFLIHQIVELHGLFVVVMC